MSTREGGGLASGGGAAPSGPVNERCELLWFSTRLAQAARMAVVAQAHALDACVLDQEIEALLIGKLCRFYESVPAGVSGPVGVAKTTLVTSLSSAPSPAPLSSSLACPLTESLPDAASSSVVSIAGVAATATAAAAAAAAAAAEVSVAFNTSPSPAASSSAAASSNPSPATLGTATPALIPGEVCDA